jgi:hypothetical protein
MHFKTFNHRGHRGHGVELEGGHEYQRENRGLDLIYLGALVLLVVILGIAASRLMR